MTEYRVEFEQVSYHSVVVSVDTSSPQFREWLSDSDPDEIETGDIAGSTIKDWLESDGAWEPKPSARLRDEGENEYRIERVRPATGD